MEFGNPAGALGTMFTATSLGVVPPANCIVVKGLPNATEPAQAARFVLRMFPNASPGPPHDVVHGSVSVLAPVVSDPKRKMLLPLYVISFNNSKVLPVWTWICSIGPQEPEPES